MGVAHVSCQYCGEEIRVGAKVCPHCRTNFSQAARAARKEWAETGGFGGAVSRLIRGAFFAAVGLVCIVVFLGVLSRGKEGRGGDRRASTTAPDSAFSSDTASLTGKTSAADARDSSPVTEAEHSSRAPEGAAGIPSAAPASDTSPTATISVDPIDLARARNEAFLTGRAAWSSGGATGWVVTSAGMQMSGRVCKTVELLTTEGQPVQPSETWCAASDGRWTKES